jgi:hypothetical protein
MMKRALIILMTLTSLMFIGCSNKKNPLGQNSNLRPKVTKIFSDDLFDYAYSYENEVENYGLNDIVTIGNFRKNKSIALIRFADSSFPKSDYELTSDAKLTFSVSKNYFPSTEKTTIKIGKINESWTQNYATWKKTSKDINWVNSWNDLSTITLLNIDTEYVAEDSTFTFIITKEVMQEIIDDLTATEPKSFGFALFSESEDDHYIEAFSETSLDKYPTLSFKYQKNDAMGIEKDFKEKPLYTTTIHSKSPVEGYYLGDDFAIRNIVPTRVVMKLAYPKNAFELPDGLDTRKITINKAELVLFRDKSEEASHIYKSIFQIIPYSLSSEYSNDEFSKLPIKNEDIRTVKPYSIKSFNTEVDSVSINITSIVQEHVSELQWNFGIVLASYSENKDNSYVQFFSNKSEHTDKRPYLKLIYSYPELDN